MLEEADFETDVCRPLLVLLRLKLVDASTRGQEQEGCGEELWDTHTDRAVAGCTIFLAWLARLGMPVCSLCLVLPDSLLEVEHKLTPSILAHTQHYPCVPAVRVSASPCIASVPSLPACEALPPTLGLPKRHQVVIDVVRSVETSISYPLFCWNTSDISACEAGR